MASQYLQTLYWNAIAKTLIGCSTSIYGILRSASGTYFHQTFSNTINYY